MTAKMNANAGRLQFERGLRDAQSGNAYGHSNEVMAYAKGSDQRQARDAYDLGWMKGRNEH